MTQQLDPERPVVNKVKKPRRRSVWFHVHFWIGWVAALPLILVCATGLPLAFHAEVEHRAHPERFQLEVTGEPMTTGEALERLLAQPGVVHHHVGIPRKPNHAYSTYSTKIREGGPNQTTNFYLNPYTGEIAEKGPASGGWMDLTVKLHRNLVAGPIGAKVVAGSSVLLAVTGIVGLVLWWPMRRRTFRRAWTRGNALDWHNVIGLIALLPLIVMALTGATFTWGKYVLPLLAGKDAQLNPPQVRFEEQAGAQMLPIGQIVSTVEALYPDAILIAVQPASNARNAHQFLLKRPTDAIPHGGLRLYMNPVTGGLHSSYDSTSRGALAWYRQWFGVLHTFHPFNIGLRAIWGLVSFAGAVMVVTGLWISVKRWKRRRPA